MPIPTSSIQYHQSNIDQRRFYSDHIERLYEILVPFVSNLNIEAQMRSEVAPMATASSTDPYQKVTTYTAYDYQVTFRLSPDGACALSQLLGNQIDDHVYKKEDFQEAVLSLMMYSSPNWDSQETLNSNIGRVVQTLVSMAAEYRARTVFDKNLEKEHPELAELRQQYETFKKLVQK